MISTSISNYLKILWEHSSSHNIKIENEAHFSSSIIAWEKFIYFSHVNRLPHDHKHFTHETLTTKHESKVGA